MSVTSETVKARINTWEGRRELAITPVTPVTHAKVAMNLECAEELDAVCACDTKRYCTSYPKLTIMCWRTHHPALAIRGRTRSACTAGTCTRLDNLNIGEIHR